MCLPGLLTQSLPGFGEWAVSHFTSQLNHLFLLFSFPFRLFARLVGISLCRCYISCISSSSYSALGVRLISILETGDCHTHHNFVPPFPPNFGLFILAPDHVFLSEHPIGGWWCFFSFRSVPLCPFPSCCLLFPFPASCASSSGWLVCHTVCLSCASPMSAFIRLSVFCLVCFCLTSSLYPSCHP